MTRPEYQISNADRAPLPNSYKNGARYLGYREADRRRPFAHHFRPTAAPIQAHVRDMLSAGRQPAHYGFELAEAADMLSRPGYLAMETGWLRTDNGTLLVAALTDMPGVTAAMWDWWFGWHSNEPARYKLWHPGAHQFAAIAENRSQQTTLTDRQRYQNNTSFVDEYVGATYSRLAIRFIEPGKVGFSDPDGTTTICAAVGLNAFPIISGWIVHQVRPTDHGVEMRSRFFLGHTQIICIPKHSTRIPLAAQALTHPLGSRSLTPIAAAATRLHNTDLFAHDLAHHCATEMNHLSTFLPGLFEEFHDSP